MTPLPQISVVMPAYKAADTISRALASVAAQTCQPCETIVVDDASPDATAAARNIGISEAEGVWIAFLDADDAWLPHTVQTQMAIVDQWRCENPKDDPVFVCGSTVPFPEHVRAEPNVANAEVPQTMPFPVCLDLMDFAIENPVPTSTVLVRKDALDAVRGFDEQFRGPEDYDLWIRLAGSELVRGQQSQSCMLRVKHPLAYYHTQTGSLSMSDVTFLPQVLRVLDKAYGPGGALTAWPQLKSRAYAHQLAGASWMAYRRGSRGRALKLLGQSWMQRPAMKGAQRWKLLVRYLAFS